MNAPRYAQTQWDGIVPLPGTVDDSFARWQEEVARLSPHYDPNADRVLKDALGLAGEVGEVVELIKKDRFHGIPFDADKLRGEVGDVLWYLTDLCALCGFTLADAAQANADKLRARYPNGFVKGGGVREPAPDSAAEFYAAEVERARGRAPA